MLTFRWFVPFFVAELLRKKNLAKGARLNELCFLLQSGQRGQAPAVVSCLIARHRTREDIADFIRHKDYVFFSFICFIIKNRM